MRRVLVLGLATATALLWSVGLAERPYEGVELNIVLIEEPESRAAASQALAQRFFEETGIRVNFDLLTSRAMTEKIQIESVARTGAIDVIRTGPGIRANHVEAGWIRPLDPYIEMFGFESELADWTALNTHARFGDDPTVWAIPVNANIQLLVYRTDLFGDPEEQAAFKARYGYELRPPETTVEMLDAAEFFTRDTTGDGRTDLYGYFERLVMTFPLAKIAYKLMYSTGHTILDADGNVAFDTPAMAEGLEWYRELKQYMPDTVAPGDYSELERAWGAGELAMTTTWIGTVRNFMDPERNPNTHDVTAVTLVPRFPDSGLDHGKAIVGGGGYAVHTDSPNPEAAAKWIFWLLSEENLEPYVEAGGNPPRGAFFEHPMVTEDEIWGRIMPYWFAALELTGENRLEIPEVVGAFNENLAVMVSDILFEDADPTVTLRETATENQRLLDRRR